MNGEVTNEMLALKIDSLRELCMEKFDRNDNDHNLINDHFTTLNGQVSENTKFRIEGKLLIWIGAGVVSVIVSFLAALMNKYL